MRASIPGISSTNPGRPTYREKGGETLACREEGERESPETAEYASKPGLTGSGAPGIPGVLPPAMRERTGADSRRAGAFGILTTLPLRTEARMATATLVLIQASNQRSGGILAGGVSRDTRGPPPLPPFPLGLLYRSRAVEFRVGNMNPGRARHSRTGAHPDRQLEMKAMAWVYPPPSWSKTKQRGKRRRSRGMEGGEGGGEAPRVSVRLGMGGLQYTVRTNRAWREGCWQHTEPEGRRAQQPEPCSRR